MTLSDYKAALIRYYVDSNPNSNKDVITLQIERMSEQVIISTYNNIFLSSPSTAYDL
jgi:hypothetical protein